MKTYSATEARFRISELLEETKQDVVQITQHNKPVAAVVSWESYQALVDSVEMAIAPDVFTEVKQGVHDYYAGRLKSWEAFAAEQNLPPLELAEAAPAKRVGRPKRAVVPGAKRRGAQKSAKCFVIAITAEAEGNFRYIPNPVTRNQVAAAIVTLARNPEGGRTATYLRGLRTLRASTARYTVVYRVIAEQQLAAVLAIFHPEQEEDSWFKPKIRKK